MVRASPNFNAFDAGEFAPITEGRTDLSRYGFACRILENFLPRVVGPASRRPGTSFIATTRYPDRDALLVRFEYSTEQAYVLEFGHLYVRFYRNDGPLLDQDTAKTVTGATTANPCVITCTGHGFQNNDQVRLADLGDMTQLNGGTYRITVLSVNTFSLQDLGGNNINSSGFAAYTSGGAVTRIRRGIAGATQANPVVLTMTAHGYSNGDDIEIADLLGMTQLNGRRFRVANKTANTFELTDHHGTAIDGTGYSAYVSGGTAARVYTLATTYQEGDLAQLKFAQSADILYIAHTEYVPRKLQRYGATNWVLSQIDFQDGPYLPVNASQATLAPSAASGAGITISCTTSAAITGAANNGAGAIRVTAANHGWKTGDKIDITGVTGTTEANAAWTVTRVNANTYDLNGSTFANAYTSGGTAKPHIFDPTDLGRIVRLQHGATWGYAKITAYTSAVQVTADVLSNFGAATATASWRLGLYSQGGGYPACVTFYEGRLFWGGCPLAPTRVDGSMSSNYETFSPSSTASVVADDNAVAYPLDSGDVNNVLWMKDDEKGLLVGTKGGEWVVRANTLNGALTPTNVKATRATTYGSYEGSQPVRTGKDVIFVQRKRRKIRNLNYTYEIDGFNAGDLTILSGHIGRLEFGQLAFQSEPEGWVWMTCGDGQLPVLTYDRDEQKIGWSRMILGGHQDAARQRPPIVRSVAAIPDPNDARDEIWLIVQRMIAGKTERYVELLAPEWENADDQEQAFYVDSGLIFDGRQAVTLQPGAGANVKGAVGVVFTAGGAVFKPGDVGREISMRWFDYAALDAEDPAVQGAWVSAKAKITGYTSTNQVTATVLSPWPGLDLVAASNWRLSANALSNLWHLEGETISINAEGATHPDVTVVNGRAPLTRAVGYAVAGLRFNSRLQTMRIEAGATDGTAQGKVKRINEVTFRVLQSLGGEAGPDFTNMVPLKYRSTTIPMGEPPPIADDDCRVLWEKGYETQGRIALRQSAPFPMTVIAVLPQVTTYDKG